MKTSVAVAMSGGIDSAVTALLLKRQGYNITGVFMRNWDSSDEAGDEQCPLDQDHEDMKEVCNSLNIPHLEVNFVKDYWNYVFTPFVDDFRSNIRTPNPDASCNSFIKFHKFRDHVLNKWNFDYMATGHYAQLSYSKPQSELPLLRRGIDSTKDQSYFLATTSGNRFCRVMFPLGKMSKKDVKKIAHEADEFRGLRVLQKKESMGICFVGKRKMSEFLPHYFNPTPGRFIDIDTMKVVGRHEGSELYTLGQKAKIGGSSQKYYIVKKFLGTGENADSTDLSVMTEKCNEGNNSSPRHGDIFVAAGSDHVSLKSNVLEALSSEFNWISGSPPSDLLVPVASGDHFKTYSIQIRHRQQPIPCTISINNDNQFILRFTLIQTEKDGDTPLETSNSYEQNTHYKVSDGIQAATPGQIIALYDEDICLGGGPILRSYLQ